jgi:glycyl-tRNA synthetase alpha subunit
VEWSGERDEVSHGKVCYHLERIAMVCQEVEDIEEHDEAMVVYGCESEMGAGSADDEDERETKRATPSK